MGRRFHKCGKESGMTKKINKTEKYEKFVFTQILEEIINSTGCKKEDAWSLFVNALAYNTTVAEIIERVKSLTADDSKRKVA